MAWVAVVTGGTRGIGRAISVGLKNAGYNVAANYGRDDKTAQEFSAETGSPVFKFDVSDFDACAEGIKAIEAQLGIERGDEIADEADVIDVGRRRVPAACAAVPARADACRMHRNEADRVGLRVHRADCVLVRCPLREVVKIEDERSGLARHVRRRDMHLGGARLAARRERERAVDHLGSLADAR